MTNKIVKVIGFAATVLGFGATLVSEWVKDKEMDEKIEEKVNRALAEKDEETLESNEEE